MSFLSEYTVVDIAYQHPWVPSTLKLLARRAYEHADPAHGLDHVYRVLENIVRFNRDRPLSALRRLLLACIALMHDARDHKTLQQDPTRADLLLSDIQIVIGLNNIIMEFLDENPGALALPRLSKDDDDDDDNDDNDYPVDCIFIVELITKVIETSSWSKRFHPESMMPLEWLMQYPAGVRREFFWLRNQLRAADMWDAIGHIGIRRCEQVSIVRTARRNQRLESSYRVDDAEVVDDVCLHIAEKLLSLSKAMTPELRSLAEADDGPNSVLRTYLDTNAGSRLEELHKLLEHNCKRELLYSEARGAVERAIIGPPSL